MCVCERWMRRVDKVCGWVPLAQLAVATPAACLIIHHRLSQYLDCTSLQPRLIIPREWHNRIHYSTATLSNTLNRLWDPPALT